MVRATVGSALLQPPGWMAAARRISMQTANGSLTFTAENFERVLQRRMQPRPSCNRAMRFCPQAYSPGRTIFASRFGNCRPAAIPPPSQHSYPRWRIAQSARFDVESVAEARCTVSKSLQILRYISGTCGPLREKSRYSCTACSIKVLPASLCLWLFPSLNCAGPRS